VLALALATARTTAQAAGRGRVAGRVTNILDGSPFPGVKVSLNSLVFGADIPTQTTSDNDGRFEFSDVIADPGIRYVLRAEMAGFEAVMTPTIVAVSGETITAALAMRWGCQGDDLVGQAYLRDRLLEADAVVHLKITGSGDREHWYFPRPGSCEPVRQHVASVLGVARLRPAQPRTRLQLPLLEFIDPYGQPAVTGREYLALLRWRPKLHLFAIGTMLPVDDGRLAWASEFEVPGVRDGMRADDVIQRLRAFLAAHGRR